MTQVQDVYELSPLQQGILINTLDAQGHAGAYLIQIGCRMRGALDVVAFARAWQGVVDRHDTLRTSFHWQGLDKPLQVVSPTAQLRMRQEDWRGLGVEEQALRLSALVESELGAGFDLSQPPLMRLALIQLGPREFHFLWTFHHLILEGWSASLVIKDVIGDYRSLSRGGPIRPRAVRPYRDYILWIQQQDPAKAEAFWRRTLRGFTAPTPLPADRGAAAVSQQAASYGELAATIPRAESQALAQLARQHRLTLNTFVQGAWALLLSRHAGEDDVVYGTAVAGRPHTLAGSQEMIGQFVNTLLARVKLDYDERLIPWLTRVQQQQLEMREYEHSSLIEVQGWSELPRGVPPFESILVFDNWIGDISFGEWSAELDISQMSVREGGTGVPLRVGAKPGPELSLVSAYDRRRFSAATAERLFAHFQTLLRGMATAPERRLFELPLLSEQERRVIEVEWNATSAALAADPCLPALFEAQVERTPDAIAVAFGADALTYRQLNARANQLAHRLRRLGVGPEVLVGIHMGRSLELFVALLGVLKAGGCYVPLDPAYPAERLGFMLEDSGLSTLVTQPALAGRLRLARGQELPVELVRWPLEDESDRNPHPSAGPENLAYVIYTSGSTGRPKGVQIRQRSLVNLLQSMSRRPGLQQGDVWLSPTTFSFDMAIPEIYLPLVVGGTVVLVGRELAVDGAALMRKLQECGATVLQATPTTWRLLLEAGWTGDGRLKMLCGAEPWTRELADQLLQRGGSLWNLYGPTETTVWSTLCRIEPGESSLPVGRPLANTRVYLLDRRGQPVPVGAVGEVFIGGEGVARGYLRRPELTADRFVPDPFSREAGSRLYRTGDLARYLPDGRLECVGRSDHQVKLRGFRIELGEIESVLSQHADVAQAAVIVREDEPGEKRLVAYIVASEAARSAERGASRLLTAEGLRQHLSALLPDYMVPAWYLLLDTLPLNPNGKVDRRALPKPDAPALGAEGVAPRNEVERLLAETWSEALGLPRIGVHDNFFEAGGHSLLAMRVVTRIQELFGADLSLRSLFERPTVEGLAALLLERGGPAPAPPTPIRKAPRDRPLPLSYAQERLWFLEQLAPGVPVHTVPMGLRLRGRLKSGALQRSLDEIQRRHEVLRTSFVVTDGMPAQSISPPAAFRLELSDLAALPEEARERERQRLVLEEAGACLDLSRGPLFSGRLLRLAADDHLLVLTLHHIVFDGWSLGVIVRELAELYSAFCQERPAALTELPVQYADFAVWQREWLARGDLERQLSYWNGKLAGLPVLDLPTDRPRPTLQTFRGGQQSFTLPRELSDGLLALGRDQGATLFMTLLAALQALLFRYTGQQDFAVGSPIAGRVRSELEGLIGVFVNMLVLRGDLSGNPRFREVLARVREASLQAYAAQDVPFERLVQELRPQRDLSRTPLFQVMFVLHNAPLPAVELPDLSLVAEPLPRAVAPYDLVLYMEEVGSGLAGTLEYNSDLFEHGTIERMLGHFRTLLEGVVANPEARVSDLPLLRGAELEQLRAWQGRPAEPTADVLLHERIEAQVERRPDAVAAECGDARLSYRALDASANALAVELQRLGVRPGVLVGIYMERSLEVLVALLAVLKSGGAYVPLDPAFPAERLSYMLEDSGARVLLTQADLAARVPRGAAHVVCVDVRDPAAVEVPRRSERRAHPDDLAYVIYTSGSTGRPKGVAVTHRSLVNFMESMAREPGVGSDDVLLSVTTLSFDIAGLELYLPLTIGGRVVVTTRDETRDGGRLAARLSESGATVMQATPATWRLLLESGWPGDGRLKALCGGESLARGLARQLVERSGSVWNMYGPTETTIWSTLSRIAAADAGVSIGRPIANTRVYVLDAGGHLAPAGVPGELYLGGAGLARGYLGRPELTAERFVPDAYGGGPGARLYRTGDLVRYLPDGRLEWLSRLDHQVKLRGFRIELGEIEAVLSGHPSVRQAVALVREDAPGDARLVAYVVGEDSINGAGSDAEAVALLRRHLLEKLPEYMVPAAWVFLDAFPLTPNGKLDRKALPKPEALQVRYAAPNTATDRAIAEVWQDVLRVERVGLHDNFFDLGGHSLLLMQVQLKLRQLLQRDVPILDLFEHPTVAALGGHLRNGASHAPAEEDANDAFEADRERIDRLQQLRRQAAGEEL